MIKALIISLILTLGINTFADENAKYLRWTFEEDTNSELGHVVSVINSKLGTKYTTENFRLFEATPLHGMVFRMYVQIAQGIPVKGNSIRLWSGSEKGQLIQAEVFVSDSVDQESIQTTALPKQLSSRLTTALVLDRLASEDDRRIQSITWQDSWVNGSVLRTVEVRVKSGIHYYEMMVGTGLIVSHKFKPFPNFESLAAKVYPIYEQYEGSNKIQPRVDVQINNIFTRVQRPGQDSYKDLRFRRYTEDKLDPVLGMTEEGQKQGYWAYPWVLSLAQKIFDTMPLFDNSFSKPGMVLSGKYASVSIHPDARDKFSGIQFHLRPSPFFIPAWKAYTEDGQEKYELVPSNTYFGRSLVSANDAYSRPANRYPDHDPVKYINEGFDEVQVYYAVNELMESLNEMGFRDPVLSTKPFHGFLYDPDISMRNNAYYTNDTINFTTYTSDQPNFARDNSTIWHELGHGVMDRLMGPNLDLADSGGLSEGMADFVADMVIQKVTDGRPFDGSNEFRIINRTLFNVTNEAHDDGEAYGGAMKDFLSLSMEKYGRKAGLYKVADLTMAAMRLARNHPHLTANDWFQHMLFADQLGSSEFRGAGEMRELIVAAVQSRNFSLDGKPVAQFVLANGLTELNKGAEGTRENPLKIQLKESDKQAFKMKVKLTSGDTFKFAYPMTVKIFLSGGPIQGALAWDGEDVQPIIKTVQSDGEELDFELAVKGKCQEVNRDDGSCVDYASVQLWPEGTTKPIAKKRFYVRLYSTPN